MSIPALLPNGFLPPGIHAATLQDIIAQFGIGNPRRQELGTRLEEFGSIRYTEDPMWLCHKCYGWGERRLQGKFVEPTTGDLFTPDDE